MNDHNKSKPGVTIILVVIIFLCALFCRLWFLKVFMPYHWEGFAFYPVDALASKVSASRILAGAYDSPPVRPPFTEYSLALIRYLLGTSNKTLKLVYAVIGSLIPVLCFFLARRIFDNIPYKERGGSEADRVCIPSHGHTPKSPLDRGDFFNRDLAAVLAGGLCSLSFGLLVNISSVNSELWYILQTLSLMLLWLWMEQGLTWFKVVLLGALVSLMLLTRGEAILWFLFLAALLLMKRDRPLEARLGIVGIYFAVVCILLTPWTYRNYKYFHALNQQRGKKVFPEFVPITIYGPLNFAKANSPFFLPYFDRRTHGSNMSPSDNRYDMDDPYIQQLLLYGYRIGLRHIFEHPIRTVAVNIRKLYCSFQVYTYGFAPYNIPFGLRGFYRSADIFVAESRWGLWVLWGLTNLGCLVWAAVKHRQRFILPLFLLIETIITVVLFFGYVRLGLILLPITLLCVAYAASRILAIISPRALQPYLAVMAAVMFLLISAAGYLFDSNRIAIRYQSEFFNQAHNLFETRQYRQAFEQYKAGFDKMAKARAYIYNPIEISTVHSRMGECAVNIGLYEQAEKYLLQAIELDSINGLAHLRLGELYYKHLNQPDKALWYLNEHIRLYPNHPYNSHVRRMIVDILTREESGTVVP